GEQPKRLDYATTQDSNVIITMGCGDTCPVFPGKRYEDWELTDPAGQPLEVVRAVRDDIRARVERLLADLSITPQGLDEARARTRLGVDRVRGITGHATVARRGWLRTGGSAHRGK